LSAKVSYEIKDHQKLLDLIGMQKIDGQNALFQLSGAPPKCLYCKQFGHMRKDCVKLKTICTTCKKTGHGSEACTIANRINSDNSDVDIDDDDLLADEKLVDEQLASKPSSITDKLI
jgi:hypothetical protein